MRVLLTGAYGRVGTAIIDHLGEKKNMIFRISTGLTVQKVTLMEDMTLLLPT